MKRKLKAVFYGITHEHSAGKLRTVEAMSDTFEIAAIVDDRPRGFVDFQADPVDVSKYAFVTEEEALKIPDVDVAFVEPHNLDLMRVASLFIDRGIPIHCDKPCGTAMEPYRSLVAKCRAKNLPFQIGYMFRGNPALKFARAAVQGGWLGEVAFVEADMNHNYGNARYCEFIRQFEGGIFFNLGCHLIDLVLPLVKGEATDLVSRIGDAPEDPAGSKTSAEVLMRFGGTEVLLRTCSNMRGGDRRLRIDGTNGTLEICPIERFDGQPLKLMLDLKNPAGGYAAGRHMLDFGILCDRYRDQLEDLAAIVRGDKPNDQDYDHDLKVHELTLKACGLQQANF